MKEGTLFAERFEVVTLETSGGMGTVYRAKDTLTGERVALKIVHQRGAADIGRFMREGRALAELHHPGIVRYVAHGVTSQNDAYLAMEWLDGEDLGELLNRVSLGIRESVSVVRHAAVGLAFAHGRGLVHRDIKPSNLFLVGSDIRNVKVLDFGIVRQVGVATEITKTGAMLGTPGYMSPEQIRGKKTLDARADVFALGCVLYRCLTGRTPFHSDDAIAVLTRVLFEEVMPPRLLVSEIPPALDDLVVRLLSKDPAGRPADASALLEAAPSARPAHEQRDWACTWTTRGHHEPRAASSFRRPHRAESRPPGPARRYAHGRSASTIETRLRVRVEALGGRFEMLSNGSFVVMCGGKGTARDQAAQAARCALTVRAFLPDAPIAVATGRSDASLPMPVGEVIERAARLLRGAANALDQSEPTLSDEPSVPVIEWEPLSQAARLVRIDDVTAALLGARFEVTRESDGLALLRERDAFEPDSTVMGVTTPFIGRERELTLLSGIFEQCTAEPVASAVLVTGGAGVGKSRLLHEFTRRLARTPDGAPGLDWSRRTDERRGAVRDSCACPHDDARPCAG